MMGIGFRGNKSSVACAARQPRRSSRLGPPATVAVEPRDHGRGTEWGCFAAALESGPATHARSGALSGTQTRLLQGLKVGLQNLVLFPGVLEEGHRLLGIALRFRVFV